MIHKIILLLKGKLKKYILQKSKLIYYINKNDNLILDNINSNFKNNIILF